MRCRACNVILEDHEAVKKDHNGEYFDMCNPCLSSSFQATLDDNLDIPINISVDLLTINDF